jgi:hypothetical protein
VARLRALLDDGGITVAEKFRKVFEAYQVENEYGRTIEAYRDTVTIEGQAREVDLLRIGRIGLYYLTPDGGRAAAWDPIAGGWVALGGPLSGRAGSRFAPGAQAGRARPAGAAAAGAGGDALSGLRTTALLLVALAASLGPRAAVAEELLSLDRLLEQVREGRREDRASAERREAAFRAARDEQAALLERIRSAVTAEEARSGELERAFEENERERGELAAQLDERLGELKELFGVLQQVTEETRGQFDASLTQVQYPERRAFLDDLGEKLRRGSRLASLEEIERLWFELQREMVASGKIEQVNLSVLDADGSASQRRVTRVGLFNLVTCRASRRRATSPPSTISRRPPRAWSRLASTRPAVSCSRCWCRHRAWMSESSRVARSVT